jgi:hypothetical protein
MSGPGPYRAWPPGQEVRGSILPWHQPETRWIHAGNLFGQHVMKWALDSAWQQIPESASDEARTLAKQAAVDALHGVMSILDGVPPLETEDGYRIEYVLLARIQEFQKSSQDWTTVETFELAPQGHGLRQGLAGWIKGDFECEPAAPQRSPEEIEAFRKQSQDERILRKRQDITRRTAGGPPCPYCGKPLRSAQAKQCFQCGRSWREAPPGNA